MVFGLLRLTIQENFSSGRTKQYLYIEKMRNTPVPIKYSLFDITTQGIRIISGMKSPVK
jgi:KaiC/GvpD/RAD55 family RecA-like ATPase